MTATGWSATATARFPEEFYATVAQGGWLGIAMPEAYGGAGLGIGEAAVMMQAVAQSGAGFSGASALHMNIFGLNPVVRFGSAAQKAALPAAPHPRRGEGVLCRDRARCRPRHDASQDEGGARRRSLRRLRPQDLDLDGAGRAQDAAAGAHHAHRADEEAERRHQPLLHRPRPQRGRGARDRQDGPPRRRFQHALHRRAQSTARGSHRRRGRRLPCKFSTA